MLKYSVVANQGGLAAPAVGDPLATNEPMNIPTNDSEVT